MRRATAISETSPSEQTSVYGVEQEYIDQRIRPAEKKIKKRFAIQNLEAGLPFIETCPCFIEEVTEKYRDVNIGSDKRGET